MIYRSKSHKVLLLIKIYHFSEVLTTTRYRRESDKILYQIYLNLLEKTGESTYQVCEDTGIKQNIMTNWKHRAESDPEASLSMKNMKKLSDHFHVSLDYWVS